MELKDVFQRYRRLLAFAHLVGGNTLRDRIRNLSWIIALLASGDDRWQLDELATLGQESTPFMPVKEIASEVAKIKMLRLDASTQTYVLQDVANIYEQGLPAAITEASCQVSLKEFRELLEGGPAQRMVWRQSDLYTILNSTADFGFHCIEAWRSLVINGSELSGVPFLWNVTDKGVAAPHGELPASSATIDIVRLAIEPLQFLGRTPTTAERSMIEWSFDRIYQNITIETQRSGYYSLPLDDSYPNAVHPINDSQCRVIRLLVSLLEGDEYLDSARRQRAESAALALTRYLLSQQLVSEAPTYGGFWSFHRYDDAVVDGFQILSINSELAVTALESVWALGDNRVKDAIKQGLGRLLDGLRRTAITGDGMIGWRRHFAAVPISSDSSTDGGDANRSETKTEILTTARALLMFAIAQRMNVGDDASDFIRGAISGLERQWVPKLRTLEDDVEFIPYRTPEQVKWSDVLYRITNPISAVMPYCLLAAARFAEVRLPITLTEPMNDCVNFALEHYGGYGYWRDASTGLAYPTNTAFNMQMLIEYARASELRPSAASVSRASVGGS